MVADMLLFAVVARTAVEEQISAVMARVPTRAAVDVPIVVVVATVAVLEGMLTSSALS